MEINALNKIFTTQLNKIQNKINLESKDTVSFSGRKLKQFESENEAYEFYKKTANKVNKSLKDDDDITAFEILGYDIDSDFETDKITIKGDYKPFFEYKLKEGNPDEIHYFSYKNVKINEKKLLSNVEKITGKKLVAPDFEPFSDYKIDNTQIYSPNVEKKLQKLLEKRTQKAKLALADNDSQQALEYLGFKTKKNDDGGIIIDGGYSNVLLTRKDSTLELDNFGLNENELLKNVVKINGGAKFSYRYFPDHYIEIDEVKNWGWTDKAKEMVLMNPSFIEEVNKNKETLAKGDNFSVLQNLGYDVEKTEEGKIIIKQSFSDYIRVEEAGLNPTVSYSQLGYDLNTLLKNVSFIDGNLHLHSSKLSEVDKNLVVTGDVFGLSEEELNEIFKHYTSNRDLYSQYSEISPKILDTFVSEKVLQPTINSNIAYFFKEIDEKTNEFLTNIAKNRETILDANEISEKYGISLLMIKNAINKGELLAYALEDSKIKCWNTNEIHNYLFDITDKRNEVAIKHFVRTQKKSEKESKEGSFYSACIKNEVKLKENPERLMGTGLYTFADIERFGYGTKDDLIAHCDLLINAYSVRKHLNENDEIKISHPTLKAILNLSRECNPSLIKLSDLEKLIGEDFRQMVIDGKFSILTSTLFEKLPRNKYYINLDDEKNMQALKSIDNAIVQKWLVEKLEEVNTYKEANKAKVEEFKHSKAPTKEEALKEYQDKKFQAELRSVLKADDEKIAKKRKAWENRRNLSLRTTIAWVLSPNTKDAQKEKTNPAIKEILTRNEEIREINSLVLAGEMTKEEAKIKIQELKLTKDEEIAVLSFYKGAWEMAGTEEWIEALKQAKEIAKAYKEGGLEAITDNKVKDRLELWEKKWGKK